MAVQHLPTRGYSNGTLVGSIALVTLRGYFAATSVAITGTTTDPTTEADMVTGERTTIIALTGDTWAAAGTGPIGSTAVSQSIIDGVTSAQSEAAGWNAEIRDKELVASLVRTSATVATITWTAAPAYDITADETITVTVPAAALVTSSTEVVGAPTFSIEALRVSTGAGSKRKRAYRKYYPRRVSIDGRLITVRNAEDERRLLLEWRAMLERKVEAAETLKSERKARLVVRRVEKRIEKTFDREAEWRAQLLDDDEEIMLMLH